MKNIENNFVSPSFLVKMADKYKVRMRIWLMMSLLFGSHASESIVVFWKATIEGHH